MTTSATANKPARRGFCGFSLSRWWHRLPSNRPDVAAVGLDFAPDPFVHGAVKDACGAGVARGRFRLRAGKRRFTRSNPKASRQRELWAFLSNAFFVAMRLPGKSPSLLSGDRQAGVVACSHSKKNRGTGGESTVLTVRTKRTRNRA